MDAFPAAGGLWAPVGRGNGQGRPSEAVEEAESITEWKRGDRHGAALEASFSIDLGGSPSAAGKILSFSSHFVLDNL